MPQSTRDYAASDAYMAYWMSPNLGESYIPRTTRHTIDKFLPPGYETVLELFRESSLGAAYHADINQCLDRLGSGEFTSFVPSVGYVTFYKCPHTSYHFGVLPQTEIEISWRQEFQAKMHGARGHCYFHCSPTIKNAWYDANAKRFPLWFPPRRPSTHNLYGMPVAPEAIRAAIACYSEQMSRLMENRMVRVRGTRNSNSI